jgi:L-ascorbate metabolism protein UlaG (beta-lactamase superfamily)
MRITFLGHAAFLISHAGIKIITDPYSSEIGYLPIDRRADFVTLSHENPKWHSCLDDVRGAFEIVRGLEFTESCFKCGPLKFGAVRVFEKPNEGENAMIWIEIDGVRVLHMGDCGVLPNDETLQKCGRVDILLALAGGSPTLELDDLMILVGKLSPKIVIPMHYGVPGLQMKALGVEEIQKRFDWPHAGYGNSGNFTVNFNFRTLPRKTQLLILPPLRVAS